MQFYPIAFGSFFYILAIKFRLWAHVLRHVHVEWGKSGSHETTKKIF